MNALQRNLLRRARLPKQHLNGRRQTSTKEPAKPESKDAEPVDIPSSLWYRRLGPVTDFLSWFHKTQGKRPLTVQFSTTLVTYLTGDLLAQEIGGEAYNPNRTLRMLTIGAVASIPGYKW